jgi:hypothetical protein
MKYSAVIFVNLGECLETMSNQSLEYIQQSGIRYQYCDEYTTKDLQPKYLLPLSSSLSSLEFPVLRDVEGAVVWEVILGARLL